MGILTDYGYKGLTYKQDVSPPLDASPGDTWFDTNDKHLYMFTGTNWVKQLEWNYDTVAEDRGIFGGGYNGSLWINSIDYININSTGDAIDFGDLIDEKGSFAATSNGINNRGVFGGGNKPTENNIIQYITISTIGDSINFGDLTAEKRSLAATSNGSNDRGIFGGGQITGSVIQNVIEYITISSTGDATDFGDLTIGRSTSLGSCSNGTSDRGVFGGGNNPSFYINIIDYITISSTGDATDFGDLTLSRGWLNCCSNDTNDRGVFAGGYTSTGTITYNVIDYITITSTGNSIDFGDLVTTRMELLSTSNGLRDRGVFGGGSVSSGGSPVNTIDYITISSTGNASDFGDLTITKRHAAATSNSAL